MKITEKIAKNILSPSQVYDYVINPYVGCQHACIYCYAKFMKRFTGHKEAWGDFVDIKINSPDLLKKEIIKKKKGTIWISGVCDPYQPLERKYKITEKCLEILAEFDWPVVIQTKSPLILRDIEILKEIRNIEVGFSIGTADDLVRKAFEPKAPGINKRIDALEELRNAGINTYAMIAPILPKAEKLIELLSGKIEYVILDRMNYSYGNPIYEKHGWQDKKCDKYFVEVGEIIARECKNNGIEYRCVY